LAKMQRNLKKNLNFIQMINDYYIFIGYSTSYKGYKCYHPPSRKILVSRHVVLDETVFPYKPSTTIQPSSHTLHTFDTWIPHTNSHNIVGNTKIMDSSRCFNPLPRVSTLTQNTHDTILPDMVRSRPQPKGSPAPP
jgi:hypothetical protein